MKQRELSVKIGMSVLMWSLVCLVGCEKTQESVVIATDKNGTYTSGPWSYDFIITNPGSRSQGSLGRLSYEGESVPKPINPADYYDTPLGQFIFVGMAPGTPDKPIRLWDPQGWVLVDPNAPKPTGKAIIHPNEVVESLMQADKAKQAKQQMIQMIKESLAEGGFEAALAEEDGGEPGTPKDPWGTPYKVFSDFRGGEGGGAVVRVIVTSAGPDKQFDTDDDLEEHSNFVPAGSSDDVDIMGELEGMTESGIELAPEE